MSSSSRRVTLTTASVSAVTAWSSGPSMAARSSVKGTSAARERADFENFARLAQTFPQLDSRSVRSASRTTSRSTRATRHGQRAGGAFRQALHGVGHSRPKRRRHHRDGGAGVGRDRSRDPGVISLINVDSPLRYDDRMLDAMLEYAKANQAVVDHAVPADRRDVAGLDRRTLAQQIGEALAGIALTQPIRRLPRGLRPFLEHRHAVGLAELRDAESAIGLLCTGQIARHFGLPWRGGGPLTRPGGRRAGRVRGR